MATPFKQLLSRTLYYTDGITTAWDFSFAGGYLDVSHVKAHVDDTLGTRTPITVLPSMVIGEYQLEITPALAAGDTLTIYRDTPKDAPLVDFTDESGFSEIALDTNAKQAVFVAAEATDTINTTDIAGAIEASIAAGNAAGAATASATASSASALAASIYADQAGDSAAAAAGSESASSAHAIASAASAVESAASASESASAATTVVSAFTEDLAASSGASLVGYLPAGVGAVATDSQTKLRTLVSVFDGMNAVERSDAQGITAFGSDHTTAINIVLGWGVDTYFPPGRYKMSRPMNLSARRMGDLTVSSGRRVFGAGVNKTSILAQTFGYPAVDFTGSNGVTLSDMWIIADQGPNGAHVGIANRRGTSSAYTSYCHFNQVNNVTVNMPTIPTANGGAGTIGFLNHGGEQCSGHGVSLYANLPMYVGNILNYTGILKSSDIPVYGTEYEVPNAGSVSCTNLYYCEYSLIAYDSYRSLYLAQVGAAKFETCYSSTRAAGGAFLTATKESVYLPYGGEQLDIELYQEEVGKFGGVFRQGHAYLNFGGSVWNSKFLIGRGANYDAGWALPPVPVSSIILSNGADLFNCELNLTYYQSTYNASSQVPGFAVNPINFSGGSSTARNCKFVLDSLNHDNHLTDWPNGTVSSTYVNHFNGASYKSLSTYDGIRFPVTQVASADPNTLDDYVEGTWTPTGTNVAAVAGQFVKVGKHVTCWGTVITSGGAGPTTFGGLPYVSAALDANNFHGGTTYFNSSQVVGTQLGIVVNHSANTFSFYNGSVQIALVNASLQRFVLHYTV